MNTRIVRTHWKWGLLALLVLALTLTWGHSGSQTAQAVGPEISLGAKGAVVCDSPDKPTKCWATYLPGDPKAWEFQITVNANVIPVGGYSGFQSEVLFGGLTYNQRTYCEDYGKTGGDGEVTWPDGGGFCMRQSITGGVGHSDLTFIIPPFPKSNHVGELVQLDMHCPSLGSFTVTLTAWPSSPTGSVYADLSGTMVPVKTDPTGDADSLTINCVEATSQINITKLDAVTAELLAGACFEVWDETKAIFYGDVCDNDVKPAVFIDEDPADGLIRVTFLPGRYSVEESQAPPGYNLDPMNLLCVAEPGFKCEVYFYNVPKPSEINITKTSRVDPQPVPGACFDVWDESNTTLLFSVCDNDFQAGMPESHPICDADGTPQCEDADPANGSVRVAVSAGNYSVMEVKAPMNHTLDPGKKACDAKLGKCELAFENVVIDALTPWLPEDVTGDNAVSGLDFFAVLRAFGTTKP